jgi:hypothetical protein
MFTIPQLAGLPGAAAGGQAQFHRLVGERVIQLFAAWEARAQNCEKKSQTASVAKLGVL